MIKLKNILFELKDLDIRRLLSKINNNEYRFFDQGDNGRVYEIDGEDKLFKITNESDEFDVATVIVGRASEFSTFIPIYYVDDVKQLYIMSKASSLNNNDINSIDVFMNSYKEYAREIGGEASVFDYINADGARDVDPELISFLRALQRDINKMGILDLDLDLDFKTDNIMRWQGRLVLIDW
tara:strand:+ start:10302 stop:10847 length:546 start_codon:yes stop_codon:yes gene_type:complete